MFSDSDNKNPLSPTLLYHLTAPQVLNTPLTLYALNTYTERVSSLNTAPWRLGPHGHRLPGRKNPCHSYLRNAQSTWSSLPLLNVYHPPHPVTLLSYLSRPPTTPVGLWT